MASVHDVLRSDDARYCGEGIAEKLLLNGQVVRLRRTLSGATLLIQTLIAGKSQARSLDRLVANSRMLWSGWLTTIAI